MKNIFLALLFVSSLAHADVKNTVLGIGQKIFGALEGAPLTSDSNGNLAMASGNVAIKVTGTVTTTSTTDVSMTSMVTPALVAGVYQVEFNTTMTSNTSGSDIYTSVYCAGAKDTASEIRARPNFASGAGLGAGNSSIPIPTTVIGECTLTTGQTMNIRWRMISGGTATSTNRILKYQRVR